MKLFNRLLYYIVVSSISFLYFSCNPTKNEMGSGIDLDKIKNYINKSRYIGFDVDTKKKYIDSSLFIIQKINNDSLRNHYLLKASFSSLKINDSARFFSTLEESMNISKELNDSLKITKGLMYKAFYYEDINQAELAYSYFYRAKDRFKDLNDNMRYGVMLSNIGKIETDFHQYNRAENNLIESIEVFNNIDRTDFLSSSYDRLGNLKYLEKDYTSSIIFFDKAEEYLLESAPIDSLSLSATINNLGNCLAAAGKIEKAIESYKDALKYSRLKRENEKHFFRIHDNLLHAQFLNGDDLDFFNKFEVNRKQKEKIDDYSGVLMNRIYLSEFQEKSGQKPDAIKTIKDALKLSREMNNTYSEIECLERLIQLDTDNSKAYFKEFIELKTEHEKIERDTENRLGLIRMKTEKYKNESVLYKEQSKWLFFIIGFLVIMTATILFFNKQKIKLLRIIQEKNEVENIQQLIAKHNIEIVKAKEDAVKVISRNLHDDVSSRLFGIRSNLKLLNDKTDDNGINQRTNLLDELSNVEKEVRNISHELRNKFDSDLKNAIEQLFENRFTKENKISYSINSEFRKWNKLSDIQKIELYRIFQEIITNILKHSDASEVWLSFNYHDDKLYTVILDDGKGFDTNMHQEGIGLKNMQERANNINTELNIDTEPNEGTKITMITSFYDFV